MKKEENRKNLLKEESAIFIEHESRTPRFDRFTSRTRIEWLNAVFSMEPMENELIQGDGSLYYEDLILTVARDVELAKVYMASSITLLSEYALEKGLPDEVVSTIQRSCFVEIASAESFDAISGIAADAAARFHDAYVTYNLDNYSYPVCQCIEMIQRFRFDRITLKQLADFVHMNPSYLSRKFHAETGRTVFEYITMVKMKEADSLMKAHLYTEGEIAEMLSYEKSYFLKLRKKYEKTTGGV